MKKAFTIAEALSVISVIGIIAVIIGASAIDSQKKPMFEIKYNKISEKISANISQDLINRTGFKFSDYNKNGTSREIFRNAVLRDLSLSSNDGDISFWGKNKTIEDDTNTITITSSWIFKKLKDETVIAFDNTSTLVIIDVNGKKSPNELNKDIFIFIPNLRNNRPSTDRATWYEMN